MILQERFAATVFFLLLGLILSAQLSAQIVPPNAPQRRLAKLTHVVVHVYQTPFDQTDSLLDMRTLQWDLISTLQTKIPKLGITLHPLTPDGIILLIALRTPVPTRVSNAQLIANVSLNVHRFVTISATDQLDSLPVWTVSMIISGPREYLQLEVNKAVDTLTTDLARGWFKANR